jgi:ubiquinone/menaquinone biosynthesis C-methylase UbiE
MPDVYATITQQDDAVVDQLARAMELRATDPRQQAFVTDYLARLALGSGSTVVEIGCGTGAITRLIAAEPAVDHVVGVDPSEGLIARARQLADGPAGVEFYVADGGATPLGDASADAVVLHTVLSHAPQPDALLVEAHRLLRAGGRIVVFDGDYATLSFALGAHDPLELCAHAFRESFINDPYVMRRVPGMLTRARFAVDDVRSAGYVQIESPDYLLSVLDRGADSLAAGGTIATETAASLKDEARRRIEAGTFFAFVAYVTVMARRL